MDIFRERYTTVICVFNEKGKVEYVNDRFITEFPSLSNDETFYQNMFAKINREFAISITNLIKRININKKSYITYKSYVKDGVEKLALVNIVPLFNKDQKLNLYSLNIADITNESLDNNKLKKLPIIDGKDILFLSLDEVYLVRAENIYSKAYTVDSCLLSPLSLKKLEQYLPNSCFVRTHKSYIVNINHVFKLVKEDSNYTLLLKDKHNIKVPISRRRSKEILARLGLK